MELHKQEAVKRLLRDLRELKTTPLPTICASPLENNIFEWHCNLLSSKGSGYEGCCFHLILQFPEDYPTNPPQVYIKNEIEHSHVHYGHLCLDLIGTWVSPGPYSGWSSAYSVMSILLQLQSFLFDDEDYLLYHGKGKLYSTRRKEASKTLRFKCTCGHDPKTANPWPWDNSWTNNRVALHTMQKMEKVKNEKTKSKKTNNVGSNARSNNNNNGTTTNNNNISESTETTTTTTTTPTISSNGSVAATTITSTKATIAEKKGLQQSAQFTEELLVHIFSFLQKQQLKKVATVCKTWRAAANSHYLWSRSELICFFTKQTFEEDVLGVGVNVDSRSRTLTSSFDFLSLKAFTLGARKSVWNSTFTHWIPLYISESHARRALPLMDDSLRQIYKSLYNIEPALDPAYMAVDILCKIMCAMIVEIMHGTLHASMKALEGYAHCQRWLIHFVEHKEGLLQEINQQVSQMISHEMCRSKSILPNMGEFLPLLSVADYRWSDVARAIVTECLDRNALWLFKHNSRLTELSQTIDPAFEQRRAKEAFQASKVSIKLIMFHVFFLEKIAQRGSATGPSIHQIAQDYDQRYGKPSEEMNKKLQEAIFDIQKKTTKYMDYFQYVGLPLESETQLHEVLRYSIYQADAKGYLFKARQQAAREAAIEAKREEREKQKGQRQPKQQQQSDVKVVVATPFVRTTTSTRQQQWHVVTPNVVTPKR